MHDLRALRDDPDAFDRAMVRRGSPPVARAILAIDEEKRTLETRVQEEQAERNRISREIGGKRGPDGRTPQELIARVGALKESLKDGEARLKELEEDLRARLAELPNLLADDVPDGPDESANREERRWGEPRSFDFEPKPHDEIGPALGMDFEAASQALGCTLRRSAGRARAARAGARPDDARHTDGRERLSRGLATALGARSRGLRHQSAAQIRR